MVEITKEKLEELYIKQGLSIRECAKALQFPTHGGFSWHLRKFGIKARPGKFQKGQRQYFHKKDQDAHGWKGGKKAVPCTQCEALITKFPSLIKEMNFCNHICYGNWRSKNFNGNDNPNHGSIAMFGSSNPNWKGGITYEPYCEIWLDAEYKESIKERDDYKCQNVDCWNNSNRLSIHHIDYDKKNCHPNNLITLCTSCNVRANYNRDFWQTQYEYVINDKLCQDTKEAVIQKDSNYETIAI
ncbi:hypothetical protein LCGC14_0646870 [marine sediment metagenome]|uniref:HNH nuclease domain-containing protein n=1 Tax=marine sediment metagenome TaxID=412755 RepID=A0A0F9QXH2_9ZZZZ|nr:HNH endonuclease [Pricia sp.]